MIHIGSRALGGYASIKKTHGWIRWRVAGGVISRSEQTRPLPRGATSWGLKHEKGLVM